MSKKPISAQSYLKPHEGHGSPCPHKLTTTINKVLYASMDDLTFRPWAIFLRCMDVAFKCEITKAHTITAHDKI